MKHERADIVATIHLFPSEAGGRAGPTPDPTLYRFSPIVVIDGKNFDIQAILDDVGSLSPGQTAKIPFFFVRPGMAKEHCALGKQFLLREGRFIGVGVIEEMSFLDTDSGNETAKS